MQELYLPSLFDYGFVVPVEAEAASMLKKMEDKKEIKYGLRKIILGTLKNKKVCFIVSGCGKIKSASATQLLIDKYPAKLYIHYGTAGALSPKLKIGDIIVAREVVEHDVNELFPKPSSPPIHVIDKDLIKFFSLTKSSSIVFGRILSGDEDIIDINRKTELATKYRGLSVDWESAGFALTCRINQVRHLIFRAISDYAHEQTKYEYQENQKLAVGNVVNFILNNILTNGLF